MGWTEGAEAPESPREAGAALSALAGGCFEPLHGIAFPGTALPMKTQVWG